MIFQDFLAYKKSFALALKTLEMSKSFPKEEKYSLTDQIRRSSRSVSANIAESYGKRRYPKNFNSKLTDSDAENSETQTWLEFALACKYVKQDNFDVLYANREEVGKLFNYMINNRDKFGSK